MYTGIALAAVKLVACVLLLYGTLMVCISHQKYFKICLTGTRPDSGTGSVCYHGPASS
jgi:hypothetical protein